MEKYHLLNESLKDLTNDLRRFIELSLQEPEKSWEEWMANNKQLVTVRCWERKGCGETGCPAYMNTCGRCWLIAGTMCGTEVQGKFALKYQTCIECDVYQDAVFKDPVSEMYEHVLTLVHSLRTKQEELREMATRDALTGLFNRNFFELTMPRELERIKRQGCNALVMMVDIDNFKYVNDRYGHLHGDKVLKESAAMLERCIRAADLLVRFGGDEFVIVMPSCAGKERDVLIERIGCQAAEWNRKWATEDFSLSFSVGHAYLDPGRPFEDAMRAADSMMYEQKLSKKSV
ncbi:MAG: GGDEF domain-containing protein [Nitrospirae bacterium]|nr:GGDEF domain-containing protein [Nitrospirota bacterium]